MIFPTGAQKLKSPSAPNLQTLRAKFGEEFWTGVLEADYPDRERVDFLFLRGMLICAYRYNSNNVQKRDGEQEWDQLTRNPPRELALFALTVPALRLIRILLEHPSSSESNVIHSGRLDSTFDRWRRSAHPSLAVLTWKDSRGFVLLWPDVTIPPSSVHVSPNGTTEDVDAMRTILLPEMGECEAARHEFVSDGGAWDEYGFQRVFGRLLGAILVRYKELTGLALLNALDRNINRIAYENKWDFSIMLGVITDRMFFCDLDETIRVCKTLLQVACDHIGVVLGQKLSRSMVQDAIASLDAHSIHTIEKYSIDAFLGSARTVLLAGEGTDA